MAKKADEADSNVKLFEPAGPATRVLQGITESTLYIIGFQARVITSLLDTPDKKPIFPILDQDSGTTPLFHNLLNRRDDPDTSFPCHMSWIILFLAALFEITWAMGLKYTEGFTRFWPTVGTLIALSASVGLLGIAAQSLPIGTAYAVWTGIGAAGTVICGIVLFEDPASAARLFCVGLILAGVIGLKIVG